MFSWSRFVLAVRLVSRGTSVRFRFGCPFSSKVLVCGLFRDCVPPSQLMKHQNFLIAAHLNTGVIVSHLNAGVILVVTA